MLQENKWALSVSEIIQTGKIKLLGTRTCPIFILSSKNPTWNALVLKRRPRIERLKKYLSRRVVYLVKRSPHILHKKIIGLCKVIILIRIFKIRFSKKSPFRFADPNILKHRTYLLWSVGDRVVSTENSLRTGRNGIGITVVSGEFSPL